MHSPLTANQAMPNCLSKKVGTLSTDGCVTWVTHHIDAQSVSLPAALIALQRGASRPLAISQIYGVDGKGSTMKFKVKLTDDAIISEQRASTIRSDLSKAAMALLAETDETITHTGSEVYFQCADAVERLNQHIEGYFSLTQVTSQVYQLEYHSSAMVKTKADNKLAASVERTTTDNRKLRTVTAFEDIKSPEAVEAEKQRTRNILEFNKPIFDDLYGYSYQQIHELASAAIGKKQENWTTLDWQRYGQAIIRRDKKWFGETNKTSSYLESAIAKREQRQKDGDETRTLEELLNRGRKRDN